MIGATKRIIARGIESWTAVSQWERSVEFVCVLVVEFGVPGAVLVKQV
jgi:hypothetical protein